MRGTRSSQLTLVARYHDRTAQARWRAVSGRRGLLRSSTVSGVAPYHRRSHVAGRAPAEGGLVAVVTRLQKGDGLFYS